MKAYLYTDVVLGEVRFRDNNDLWKVGKYDWMPLMLVLLTPEQYKKSFDADFYGYVSFERYANAKELYNKLTTKNQ